MRITRRALLAGCLAGPIPHGKEEEIPFSPTVLTFGELADKLSTPERPIRCVGSLRERGALVCLKARPRSQIEKIVLNALDLTLVPSKDGVLLLQRLPAIVAQEREWQRRLARHLEAILRETIRDAQKTLQATPTLTPEARKSLLKEMDDFTAREIAATESEDEATLKALDPLRDRMQKASDALSAHFYHRLKQYEIMLLESVVRRSLDELVRVGRMRDTFPAASVLTAEQFSDLLSGEGKGADPTKRYLETYSDAELTLRRTGRYLQIRFEGGLRSPGQFHSPDLQRTFRFHLPDISPYAEELAKPFPLLTATLFQQTGDTPPLLGTAAQAWFAERQRQAQSILSQSLFHKTFTFPAAPTVLGYLVPRWLSQAVETWCERTDTEAVMELYSLGGEYLDQMVGDGVTLERLPQETSLHDILLRCSDQWGVEETEGVCLFRNHLAFLDRTHSFPLPAFLKLCRNLSPEARFEPPVYALAAEYCRTASPPAEATVQSWFSGPPTDYRDVFVDDLEGGRAFLPLWESLTDEERQRAVTRKESDEKARAPFRVPLARFPETLLVRMAEVLGHGYLLSLHPDFLRKLREDYLIIYSGRATSHQTNYVGPAYEVTMRLERTPWYKWTRFLLPIPLAPEPAAGK